MRISDWSSDVCSSDLCHSTPANAPESMIQLYGSANGFGWNLGETIGAQVVSVPMSLPLQKGYNSFLVFMGALVVVFLVIILMLNVLLQDRKSTRLNSSH